MPFSAFKVGVQENFHWCFVKENYGDFFENWLITFAIIEPHRQSDYKIAPTHLVEQEKLNIFTKKF